MPPPRESSVGPKGRPLSALTREELGQLWAGELRQARLDGELRSVRGAAAWLVRPHVRQILEEIRCRFYELEAERDRWMSQVFTALT